MIWPRYGMEALQDYRTDPKVSFFSIPNCLNLLKCVFVKRKDIVFHQGSVIFTVQFIQLSFSLLLLHAPSRVGAVLGSLGGFYLSHM